VYKLWDSSPGGPFYSSPVRTSFCNVWGPLKLGDIWLHRLAGPLSRCPFTLNLTSAYYLLYTSAHEDCACLGMESIGRRFCGFEGIFEEPTTCRLLVMRVELSSAVRFALHIGFCMDYLRILFPHEPHQRFSTSVFFSFGFTPMLQF
jgi:hypothetical protein